MMGKVNKEPRPLLGDKEALQVSYAWLAVSI